MSKEDFFDKHGLELKTAIPELNVWYPLFGMITDVIEEKEDSLIVEMNFNIKMTIYTDNSEHKNIIKEKSLESGIFYAKFISYDKTEEKHPYEAECKTVIFGKPQLSET